LCNIEARRDDVVQLGGENVVLREGELAQDLDLTKNNVFTTKLYDIITPGFDVTQIDMRPRSSSNGQQSLSTQQVIQK
jgi:hypothetical protein